MITGIQLKQVLRNRRFLLFTVIFPVIWYIFMYNVSQGIAPSIIFGISVFIGIIGNSLATFPKRISSNIDFYSFEAKFTQYSIKNYLLDQTIIQLILNTLIFIIVLAVALVFCKFSITSELIIQFFLLTIMGIYFSIIGFILGVRLDAKTLDTISVPIITLGALTIIPFATLGAKGVFITVIDKIQMIFPGYYYSNIIDSITLGKTVSLMDVTLFIVVFLVNIVVLYFLLLQTKFIKKA